MNDKTNAYDNPTSTAHSKDFLLCRVAKVLLSSLILSLIIEWLCIAFIWPEQGHLHAQRVMQDEFGWFSHQFQYSLLYSYPVQFAEQTIHIVHHWLFIKTGIQQWISQPAKEGISAWLFFYIRSYLEASLYVIITFIIRLLIIILTSPLFILVTFVGLVDGLVQRDIRRFGVGRESAFKYHHAKRAVLPIMILAWIIYLSIPFSIHPNLILIPAALLFGLTISLTLANFKKYL